MSSLNVSHLRTILRTVTDSSEPLPNHKLAAYLDLHPSTVQAILKRARETLGVEMDTSRRGYERVENWGCLKRDEFLELGD